MPNTHGLRYRPEYRTWSNIIQRCGNPNVTSYRWYGARGITVAEEWRRSFVAFFEYMGPRPSPSHSIDRIDNDGNYEPGNVRWATSREQAANTRTTRLLEFRGRTQPVAAWARELGIANTTLLRRLDKWGWPLERALTTPPDPQRDPLRNKRTKA